MKLRSALTALILAGGLLMAALPAPVAAAAPSWNWVSGDIRPGLQPGDAGQPVKILQGDLWHIGLNPGPVDGYYGPLTESAVKTFQRQQGLPVTGRLDQATFNALMRAGGWWAPTASSAAARAGRTLDMVATAYGWGDIGPWGPITYSGQPVRQGVVAVDPNVIPIGSVLWITGYDHPLLPKGGFLAYALDTGGAIKGNRIDIFIDGPQQSVLAFGIQNVKVTILGQ